MLADDIKFSVASFVIAGKEALVAQLPFIAGNAEISFSSPSVEGQIFTAKTTLRSEAFGEFSGDVKVVVEAGRLAKSNLGSGKRLPGLPRKATGWLTPRSWRCRRHARCSAS